MGDFTRSAIEDLRRRGVFRIAAYYIVGAWVVLQVADLAFPGFDVPESAIRFVWFGAVLGFPFALLLGWRYDLVRGRITRTADIGKETVTPLNRTDRVILTTVAVAVMTLSGAVLWQISRTSASAPRYGDVVAVDPRSLAILPFKNMSGEPANQPFTSGIHDDVLTLISKISNVKVISRTSVERVGDILSVREIGNLLGVATVLEGGVQRSGDQIRINVQLIDAATDQHLWAETFDRKMTTQNIFEIQSEIAAAITAELQVTLSLQDRKNLDRKPTRSLEAYEAYLLGKQRMAVRTALSLQQADDYFRKALKFDSDYALAYVALADTNTILASYRFLSEEESAAVAEQAIAKALALDDGLGAAHASQGLLHSHRGEFPLAEAAFARAIELDPNYASTFHWYGNMLVAGTLEPERAVPLLEKARSLDPLSPVINLTLGEAYEAVGKFDHALALYRKSVEIEPDYATGYFRMALLYRTAAARHDEAVRWHRKEFFLDPSRDPSLLGFVYLELGDDEAAEFWFDRALRLAPDGYWSTQGSIFLNVYRRNDAKALAAARRLDDLFPGDNTALAAMVMLGHYDEALDRFMSAYPALSCDQEPDVTRFNLFPAVNLSLALEKTGAHACAKKILDQAALLTAGFQRLGSAGIGIVDVEIFARQGKTRLALDTLRKAIDEGYRVPWWAQAERSPHNASIADEPEFKAMMDEIRSDMALQLKAVQEMEARGELAPIVDQSVPHRQLH